MISGSASVARHTVAFLCNQGSRGFENPHPHSRIRTRMAPRAGFEIRGKSLNEKEVLVLYFVRKAEGSVWFTDPTFCLRGPARARARQPYD